MPQPLSRVRPNAVPHFGGFDISLRPNVAAWIAKCVTLWSEVEYILDTCLVGMLGANAAPTVAIYMNLLGARPKMTALQNAARTILTKDEFEIALAYINHMRSIKKSRDKIAHWIWGYAEELPDSALLVNPEYRLPRWSDAVIKAVKNMPTTQEDFQLDRTKIFVYEDSDFARIYDEILFLHQRLAMLTSSLFEIKGAWRDQRFQRLSDEPRIRPILSRIRSDQKNNQEAPE